MHPPRVKPRKTQSLDEFHAILDQELTAQELIEQELLELQRAELKQLSAQQQLAEQQIQGLPFQPQAATAATAATV